MALRAQGLYRGAIDAISGPETVAATRAFQQMQGPAGHGPRGRAHAQPRSARSARPLFGARTLHRGAFGWDVAVLQFLLVRQGISVPVNAYYDGPTLHGVRLMQRASTCVATASSGRTRSRRSSSGSRCRSPHHTFVVHHKSHTTTGSAR